MGNDLEIRLKTDRLFIEYLCDATGKTASAIAAGAGVAATTLNRYLSKKIKLKSTLKDTTIEKIASKWGFDYLELMTYRKNIEKALRTGKSVADIRKGQFRTPEPMSGGFKEQRSGMFGTPDRDPLVDQIMNATYDVWFNGGYKEQVPFERLPGLVRLLYGRAKTEAKPPLAREIKKRAADMLAVAAMESESK